MVPATRRQLKEWCLRQLGKGVIEVEVSDDQVDDCIDFALRKAQDYHFDFIEPNYYKHQLTAENKTNGWIPVPEDTLGAIEIFDLSSTLMGGGIFNAQYQFVLNNIWEWQNISLQPYFIGFQYMQFMEQILVGKQPIRYNRYVNKLYLDMDWNRIDVGAFVVVRLYQIVNPDAKDTDGNLLYPKIWGDQWLLRYTTQLIKKVWGGHLKKYKNLEMPNGQTFSGQEIYDEAVEDLKQLDEELINSFSLPACDMVG